MHHHFILLLLTILLFPSFSWAQDFTALKNDLGTLEQREWPVEKEVTPLFGIVLTDDHQLAARIANTQRELDLLTLEATAAGNNLSQEKQTKYQVAKKRWQLLTNWQTRWSNLPPPSRHVFTELGEKNAALEGQINKLIALRQDIIHLNSRLELLSQRLMVGNILGFKTEYAELTKSLVEKRSQIISIVEALNAIITELNGLNQHFIATAPTLKNQLYVLCLSQDQDALDKLFNQFLREERILRNSLNNSHFDFEQIDSITMATKNLVKKPKEIATTSEVRSTLMDLDSYLDQLELFVKNSTAIKEHWQLTRKNSLVAITQPLASPEAQHAAYSLSRELLDEIAADMIRIGNSFKLWFQDRVALFTSPQTIWGKVTAEISVFKLIHSLLLIIIAIILGHHFRPLLNSFIRWLGKRDLFKGHVGQLVRWAVLFQAVLPPLVVWGSIYAAILTVGPVAIEFQLAELFCRYVAIYYLGQKLLFGLTRQSTKGRPALWSVSESFRILLFKSYNHLGLGLLLSAITYELAEQWFGSGALAQVIRYALLTWILGWLLWAALAWRTTISTQLNHLSEKYGLKWPQKLASLMEKSKWATFLEPLALALMIVLLCYRVVTLLLQIRGLLSWWKSFKLQRSANKTTTDLPLSIELPNEYLNQFPLFPLSDQQNVVIMPREEYVQDILGAIKSWRINKMDGSLAVVGEKGVGKSTLIGFVAKNLRNSEQPVFLPTIPHKLTSEKALVKVLANALELEGVQSLNDLAVAINNLPEKTILLDEAHNLFIRDIDGYQALDALVRLVNNTSKSTFWVLVFNRYAWNFLASGPNKTSYFRRILDLPAWNQKEIQELITNRNRRAGYTIQFDDAIMEESGQDLELIEGSDGYFRLLWELSKGNPRVATFLWLSSLKPAGEKQLQLTVFRQATAPGLEKFSNEIYFALAAFCHHENLSIDELRRTLNISMDEATLAQRLLVEYGYIEPKPLDPYRFALSPRYYIQVLRILRLRHLLVE